MQTIPISTAKKVLQKHLLTQVVIVGWDKETNTYMITTYGKDKVNCEQAEQASKLIKEALKIPD